MTALQETLDQFRKVAKGEREKGTYFEQLIRDYLRTEPRYRDLYKKVETYAGWATAQNLNRTDAGIDLVATTPSGDAHAIQCKLRDADYRIMKGDLDSFLAASSKKHFARRLFISTTTQWGPNALDVIKDQEPPVFQINLPDLEKSKIDWSKYQSKKDKQPIPTKERKHALPHQKKAIKDVLAGLKVSQRGKLIMACGTGKTFVSLKIAERLGGEGGRILFLVPSLALLSQALTEWTQESSVPLHALAVCSDTQTGKKKRSTTDDNLDLLVHELSYPATTDAVKLAKEVKAASSPQKMTVVFSTYQSIQTISDAQNKNAMPEFDLIICDEAHRTTGAKFSDEDESHFVKVHNAKFIKAKRRIYMTATPRLYAPRAKAVAKKEDIQLCSMDDASLYGEDLHTLNFSDAVKQDLLVDYKVLVLAVDEDHINESLQRFLSDENNQIKVDDAAKIVGCWKALAKQGLKEDLGDDNHPMSRAVAFCQRIERTNTATTHQVGSKNIAGMFQQVVDAYQDAEGTEPAQRLLCEAEHIDGSMGAIAKEDKLQWLKNSSTPPPPNTCRILSNVRCLSEGVDVPALDAVLFLTPRNSQIDVVQSVGRVMRKSPGKKRGYIILPIVTPAGMKPHEALNDNQTYKVVWQVLQALRSHDDRFDTMVNKIELIGNDPSKMEVIAVTDNITAKANNQGATKQVIGTDDATNNAAEDEPKKRTPQQLMLTFTGIEKAIYAKLVAKVGNKRYFEDWAVDVAKIANTHISRIGAILREPENQKEKAAFDAFAKNLRSNINDSITDEAIIEMLAQHLITKPIFETLFTDFAFAGNNPMSQAMQQVLEALDAHNLNKETDTLEGFYGSVRARIAGIDAPEHKQKIMVELYDKFFRRAFPKVTEQLGLVYTPIEVVDFIIHSVNHILKQEFGKTVGSEGVHILDPFTGTGTFITRLLQSGLIDAKEMTHKYKNELHANEIILLAYYIAAINIEATYHSMHRGEYHPFEGIVLTDTFQDGRKDDIFTTGLEVNNKRRQKQDDLDIRVIMSNPPYSMGQKSENDGNANIAYPKLDSQIEKTYAKESRATRKAALYDSYVRAIRWSSDRIGQSGVIGFVTNSGWMTTASADGLRKCLAGEFSSIYVFNLRGNQRTQGEVSRKEGAKVFGSGSRASIAISILVKNPAAQKSGQIFYHDIGDYLTIEEKIAKIADFKSIDGIAVTNGWNQLTPDKHNDWLSQRDSRFDAHIALGDKSKTNPLVIFANYSMGVVTSRDAWCYNFSRNAVATNMSDMIDFYNSELKRFQEENPSDLNRFINTDSTKVSWSRGLKGGLKQGKEYSFNEGCLVPSLYRPFTKQWLYFNRDFNEMVYQMPRIFPNTKAKNRVIFLGGNGATEFSALMADNIVNYDNIASGAQCFPLYLYERPPTSGAKSQRASSGNIFQEIDSGTGTRKDAITDVGLKHFQDAHPNKTISKEDLFYYIYGILHSPHYKERYATNLIKDIPRIPHVKQEHDFWAFSAAGRLLAELHINYEKVKKYPLTILRNKSITPKQAYKVTKMKHPKIDGKADKTTLIYNDWITLKGIPLDAYNYVVSGRPALDWVMVRQQIKTDKASGIISDPNAWATETMNDPKYPLELFQRVVTVSMETLKIVKGLPKF